MAITINRAPFNALVDDSGQNLDGSIWNKAAIKTVLLDTIDVALAGVAQLAGGNTFTGNQALNNGLVTLSGTSQLIINAAGAGAAKLALTADLTAGQQAIVAQNSNSASTGSFVIFLNFASGACGSISQTNGSAVAYNTSSDARLKADAGRATDLTALRAVVVHDFTWKADGVRDRGIFAQEAHALYPRAVVPGRDETTDTGHLTAPWMTDYSKFVPDLIVGWQQHEAAIVALQAAIADRAA